MNKRGVEILESAVIFITLNLIFFAVLFLFVSRAGTGVTAQEQIYAKQIALILDNIKPGTMVTINIEKMYSIARDEKYFGRVVSIDSGNKMITVKLGNSGNGYSFRYFSSGKISTSENRIKNEIYIISK